MSRPRSQAVRRAPLTSTTKAGSGRSRQNVAPGSDHRSRPGGGRGGLCVQGAVDAHPVGRTGPSGSFFLCCLIFLYRNPYSSRLGRRRKKNPLPTEAVHHLGADVSSDHSASITRGGREHAA